MKYHALGISDYFRRIGYHPFGMESFLHDITLGGAQMDQWRQRVPVNCNATF
jgi:hypothetical protein